MLRCRGFAGLLACLNLVAGAAFCDAETPAAGDCVGDCVCVGDCDLSGSVSVDELVCGVAAALGASGGSDCPCFDANEDDVVAVNELVIAVRRALLGCQRALALRYTGAKFRMSPSRFIEAEDLDGDGILDLATTGFSSVSDLHTVSIRRGRDDGTFGPLRAHGVGAISPLMLALGDFNRDGLPDAVTANALSDNISVLLNLGDGDFGVPQLLPVGRSPRSVSVADLNGDSFLDVVAANQDSHDISVLLGDGDGGFADLLSFSVVGRAPRGVQISDVNNDGVLDVLTVNAGSWDVSVLLGRGDGTVDPAEVFPVGPGPFFMALADFNSDGAIDLATANALGGNLTALLGSGDGDFTALPAIETGPENFAIQAGDLDGDGLPDLVTAYGVTDGIVESLRGLGDGTFVSVQRFECGPDLNAFALLDANRDGRIDLVTEDGAVVLGRGDGTFEVPERSADFATSIAVEDLNNDGSLDLVWMERGGLASRLGRGDGSFGEAFRVDVAGSFTRRLKLADLNRDGRLDVVAANSRSPSGADNTDDVSVFLGHGDGTFGTAQSFAALGRNQSIAVADFDGDDLLDVAAVGNRSRISLLLGNGDGTFGAPLTETLAGESASVTTADLNGDGAADLVLSNHVLIGNGDGSFQGPLPIGAGSSLGPVAIADVDGDRILDLIAGERTGNDVIVLIGTGEATFGPPMRFAAAPEVVKIGPSAVAVKDIDGDGVVDVVTSNEASKDISILLGKGDGSLSQPQAFEAWGGTGRVEVGDLNGDDAPDLVLWLPDLIVVLADGGPDRN